MSFDRVEANNIARERYIQKMMNTYESREKKLEGRKVEFLQKNRDAKKDFQLIVIGGTASGAIAGGVTGAIVGGVCGAPGGPPTMLIGAAVGAPIGAVIGGAIGTGVAVIYLRPRYKEWCKTEAGIEFAGKMRIFLNENSVLEHLTCPISHMPVINGVRTPQGQLYEKDEIEPWVKKYGTDPMTGDSLSVEDLKADEGASLEATKKFVGFLKEKREETKKNAPDLIEGYDRLITDYREAAMLIYNTKLVTLQKRWQNGKISYEEFSTKSRELSEKYLNI